MMTAPIPLFSISEKSIIALEFVLSDERGKTARLAQTRQKINRAGVRQTLADLVMSAKPSEGFFLLQQRKMLEMSAEAVVLHHLAYFGSDVVQAAHKRIEGNDIQTPD